jgi:hypothetical protein
MRVTANAFQIIGDEIPLRQWMRLTSTMEAFNFNKGSI